MARLDIHQTAHVVGLTERHIRRLLAAGTFPRPVDRTRKGYLGRDLWSKEEVEAWRDSRDGQGSREGIGKAKPHQVGDGQDAA